MNNPNSSDFPSHSELKFSQLSIGFPWSHSQLILQPHSLGSDLTYPTPVLLAQFFKYVYHARISQPLVFLLRMDFPFVSTWLFTFCANVPIWETSAVVKMASIKILQTVNSGECVEKRESSYTVDGSVNGYNHCGEQYGCSQKTKNRTTVWSSNPTPGIYLEKIIIQKATWPWCLHQHYYDSGDMEAT